MTSQSSPNLLNLPDLVYDVLLPKLNIRGIESLRKTCRDFRYRIDRKPLDPKIREIQIWIHHGFVNVYYLAKKRKTVQMIYRKHKEGCEISSRPNPKIVKNIYFSKLFAQDLASILRHQKSAIWKFSIFSQGRDCPKFHKQRSYVFQNLRKSFETLPNIRVKHLVLPMVDQKSIMSILPFLHSTRKLEIPSRNSGWRKRLEELELDDVIKLEQWRRLRVLKMPECLVCIGYEHFTNFSYVDVGVKFHYFYRFQQHLSHSSKLRHFSITDPDGERYARSRNRQFGEDPPIHTVFYRIPDRNHAIRYHDIAGNITIKRIPLSDVPEFAVIED